MDSTICRKIESYLTDLIHQNAGLSGYKLPSERTLSLMFNASRKPVRNAYQALITKGYVTTVHGSGYFISEHIHEKVSTFSGVQNPGICLIIPSIRTQYCHDILAGAGDFCNSHQVELSIHVSSNSPEKEEQLLHSVSTSGSKGIILFPVDMDSTQHQELQKLSLRKYPLVLIDRGVPNIHASFISSENHQAMINSVEYLYNRGYKHIAYVSPPSSSSSTTDARINGFLHGLLRYYKKATPKNILVLDGAIPEYPRVCEEYFRKNPEIQVVIVSGVQRFPVLTAAQNLNLQVPEDMKLMLIDDELTPGERKALKPFIVKQNGYQIGYMAAESLYNQIYGDLRPFTRELPVSIIDTSKE